MTEPNQDGFVPSQNDARKYQPVLDPEKDPAKNFEIDLVGALETLAEEVDTDVSNFSLAGLVIQGSANVYGKKVDFVHSLTNEMLHNLENRHYEEENDFGVPGTQRKSRTDKEIPFDHFIPNPVDQAQRTKPWKTIKRQLASMPLALLPLDATEKTEQCLKTVEGEEIGSPMDFFIHRFRHNPLYVSLQADEDDDGIVTNSDAFVNSLLDSSDDSDGDGDAPIAADFDDPNEPLNEIEAAPAALAREPVIDEIAAVDLLHVQAGEPKNTDVEPKAPCKTTKPPVTRCKGVALMDPYKVEVKNERKPGLRKCHQSPKYKESPARTMKKRRSDESTDSQSSPTNDEKVKEEPFAEFFERTMNPQYLPKSFLKQMPYFDTLKPLALKEFLRRTELDRLKGKIQAGEEHQEMVHQPNDCDSDPDDVDIGNDVFGDVANDDFGGGDDDANSEDLVFNNDDFRSQTPEEGNTVAEKLKKLKDDAAAFALTTELSKRVDSWKNHMIPLLDTEQYRKRFDAIAYQKEILSFFEKEGDIIPFETVVRGKKDWDAARYLLCTLFLANHSNLEIMRTTSSFNIKLLTRALRETEMDIF